tara:strand:+ start:16057 stop:17397 length:1341 start_codon:yes stop_codon:yes gene_type:complete
MKQETGLDDFNSGLLAFLGGSPTPYHATANLASLLAAQGFQILDEAQPWQLSPGGRYCVTRNGASLIAFTLPSQAANSISGGVRMVGAHTDSPCLRVKPQPDLRKNNYVQLGVEVYGGALFNPWFDRDLSIAGRVDFMTSAGKLDSCLIDLRRPVAVIPSLAIHLDREANTARSVNPQLELPPVLAISGLEGASFDELLLTWVSEFGERGDASKVLSYELSFYDTQPPAIIGLHNEFIASARLDNLLSCYLGAQALCESEDNNCNLLICTDHEEVGSTSASGANGPFLRSVLERIVAESSEQLGKSAEDFERLIRQSKLLSIDNAHGIHPNYMDKHDANHGPILNQGPVIKINANQRYASSSSSVAFFKSLCLEAQVPVQTFVVRSDMGCGSTIGPITAAGIGVETIDIGVPTFAMHSIRELAGSEDAHNLYRVVKRFFNANSRDA